MLRAIKLFLITMMVLVSAAFAADNSIYIDQSGDNSTIGVTQTGAGNVVRGIQGVGTGNTTPAKMYGNNSTVDIQQIGSTNTLNLGFNATTATGKAYGIDLTYYVTGNSATATINSNNSNAGTSASNTIDVRQTGNNAGLNLDLIGSNNSFTATTAGGSNNTISATLNGDNITDTIAVSGGGGNGITLNQTSTNGTAGITLVGASNTVSLTQSGTAGTNGHSFTYSATGSSNSMTATQTGTIDTTINVQSVGSGNTWNITTGN
jgi:hypothetical protein